MPEINNFINWFQSINPAYSVSGLLVGLLVGITGVGGGSLMTPLLVLFFGISPTTAVGTDLIYAAITKSFGTLVHGKKQTINWKIVGLLALGSVPSSLLTIYLINHIGHKPEFAIYIKSMLGYMLLATALMVAFRSQLFKYAKEHNEVKDLNRQMGLTIITGLVLGFLVSLTSVGAGAIGVTALVLLYPRLPLIKIVGSDIAHAVPLTLFAGLGYVYLGQVDFTLLISLLIGSIPGIIIGSFLAPKLPEKIIQYALSAVLLAVSIKLIV